VPGPYSPNAESLVLRFVDWYCGKAGEFIAGKISPIDH
jgi:Rieske 2Fe-2S family protein